MLKKLKDSKKGSFTELENEKVFGFINYHLVKNMGEFKLRVNSSSAAKVEGILECKRALQLLKK